MRKSHAVIAHPTSPILHHTVRLKHQLLYASGNFGKSLIWAAFDTVLFFYLTQFGGLSLGMAGAIIMTAFLWDGMGDLLIGYHADRTGRTDFFRTLLMIGAPLCGLSFIALFASATMDGAWRIPLIALSCWGCRIGYTMCDVAHNSILVNMSTSDRTATMISGLRLMFNAAGTTAVGLAYKAGLSQPSPPQQDAAFLLSAIIGGVAYTVTLMAATRLPDTDVKRRQEAADLSFWAALRCLLTTPAYRRLCIMIVLQAGFTALFMKCLPFIGGAFFAGPIWAGDAMIVITLAQAMALPVLMMLGRQGVPGIILMRASHALITLSLIVLLATMGRGAGWSVLALAGIGIGMSGANMTVWAGLALAVHHEILGKANLHALSIGLFLAILKCAAGMGSGFMALAMATGRMAGMSDQSVIAGLGIGIPVLSSIACLVLAPRIVRHPAS